MASFINIIKQIGKLEYFLYLYSIKKVIIWIRKYIVMAMTMWI